MPLETIRLSDLIPASPERIFNAWLDAREHSAFTGSQATVEGQTFTAWDGYIEGNTLETEPHRRIVQSWRTREFPVDAGPSRLELLLEPDSAATRITLIHSEIPEGQASRYHQGWQDHYFTPMKRYFGGAVPHPGSPVAETPRKAAAKRRPAAKKKPAKKAATRRAKPARRAKSARPGKAKRGGVRRPAKARSRRSAKGRRR